MKDQVGPMDNLEGAADWPGYDPRTHGHGQGSYWEQGSWGGGCPTIGGEAAAIGQGKGQFAGSPGKGIGKGIKGACWNCGGQGHRASECNQPQKGKGKGKFGGKFGPGELKGGKKGRGKGLYDVQYSEYGKGAWSPGAGELSQ